MSGPDYKTGTAALPDFVNGRLIEAESLGGYLEAKPGHYHVFYLVVNGAPVQNIDDALQVFNDLAEISSDRMDGMNLFT